MKKTIYLYLSTLIALAMTVMVSCDPKGYESDNNGKISSIQIKEAVYVSGATRYMKITFKDNVELQLTPIIIPSDANNKDLTYTSVGTGIIEATQTGILKPIAIGIDTLIVSSNDGSGVKTRFVVEIIDHKVKATGINVSANGANMQIVKGNTFDLKAEVTVTPADVWDASLTFESLDTDIATVDENGIVTGINEGATAIRITTADGSNISRDCPVTITGEPPLYLVYEGVKSASQLSSNLEPNEGALANLLDDKNSTFWAPKINTRPVYDPACWLDVDFGEVIKFGQLGYRHRNLNYAHLQCHTFTLQGKKEEADAWTDLGEFVTEKLQVNDYQLFEVENPIEMRYLRINFIKGHLREGKTDWDYSESGNVSVGDLMFYLYNR